MFQENRSTQRALVIGLNYKHCAVSGLNGCINDTKTVNKFLMANNFTEDDIVIATDENGSWGSHSDILTEIDNLAAFGAANPHSLLWLSFSGHGGQTLKDWAITNEADHKNEGLVPTDYFTSGFVTDDELYRRLVSKLPKTNKLFALIDACHSGSMLDLPLTYMSGSGKIEGTPDNEKAEVLMLSGCLDSQYSADAYFAGAFEGALTFSFMKAMNTSRELNYSLTPQQLSPLLVSYMRSNNFDQKPTFSFTHDNTYEKPLFSRPDFDPNVYIEMKGDYWAQYETTFSVHDDDRGIFLLKDASFRLQNELIKLYFHLDNGNYSLLLKDECWGGGDGGVSNGRVCYMDSKGLRGEIKKFDLSAWDTGSKTIHFIVDSSKNTVVSHTLVQVGVDLECDYWCDELSWNIEDVRGCNVFKTDKTFSQPYEKQKSTHLLPQGSYTLKIKCSYGDGGVTGSILVGDECIHSISWRGLDWKYKNGYLYYGQFKL